MAQSIRSIATFSRPEGRTLHISDRGAFLAHRDREDAERKLCAFNLLRRQRVEELTAMMRGMGLPRFLMEATDIRERVKALASSEASFGEAKQTACFAGTYSARAEGWGDFVSLFGLRK